MLGRRHGQDRRRRARLALTGALAASVGAAALAMVLSVAAPAAAGSPPPAWQPLVRAPYPGPRTSFLNSWLSVGEAASRALPGQRPAVLFVGDSITQWWLLSGRAYWDRDFAPIGAYDDGIAGDTTSNVLARIDAGQLPRSSPRVVVLMIGTNNIPLHQSPAQITRGVYAVVAALHSRLPGSRIVLCGLLPRGLPASPYRGAVGAVNRLLAAGSATRRAYLRYLDLGPVLLLPDGSFRPGVMHSDLLHPAAPGYGLMAGPLLAAIDR